MSERNDDHLARKWELSATMLLLAGLTIAIVYLTNLRIDDVETRVKQLEAATQPSTP